MKRNYPWEMFIFGVILNFLVRNFLLFAVGLVLCIIGIGVQSCLYMGIAALLLDLILSIIQQIGIRQAVLSESDNAEYNELMDAFYGTDEEAAAAIAQEAQELSERREVLEKLVVYRTLRAAVRDGMTLDELIDAFEKMCDISVGDPDDLLFETGTYSFTGDQLFYFSLVRQFQFLDPDEYVQLRLDVHYLPCGKTRFLHRTTWGSRISGNFFDMVRSSREYRSVKDLPILSIDIRVEET